MFMCMLCGERLPDKTSAKRHTNDHLPITEVIERQRQEADEAWAIEMSKLVKRMADNPEQREREPRYYFHVEGSSLVLQEVP